MNPFFAVFKPGVWTLLWGAVMLMTAGCPLPIAYDYVIPLPKEADPTTPSSSSPSPSPSPSPSDYVPYIAEYNLQFYVPVPVAGKQPVKQAANRVGMEVQVVWKNAGGEDITESLEVFENGVVYQAEITLAAKNGYEFAADIPFSYEEGMVREQSSDDNDHPTSRTVHAEYMAVTDFSPTPSSQKVDQTDLTEHIPAPSAGKAPVSLFLAPQYAGRVQWKADGIPAEGAFKPLTAYQAVVTLIASSGYTFTGLPANAFSHAGALGVSSEADSGAVTISFEATGTIVVENYNLQDYVPVPAEGERAVKTVDRTELSVVVVWKDEGGTEISELDHFELGVVYQAVITLSAKAGYVFKEDQGFEYPSGVSSVSGDNSDAASRTLTVTYNSSRKPAVVTETNLTPYIPVPLTDAVGPLYIGSSQYTGNVAWKKTGSPNVYAGTFAAGTAYTAEISLHPAAGYTLEGLGADSFTRDGASRVSYDTGARTVRIEFGPTDKRPITDTFDLTPFLPAPVIGATPARDLYFPMAPFTGSVAWNTADVFAADTEYTATVTLTPNQGYKFAPDVAFIYVGGTVEAVSDADDGKITVTVKFRKTAKHAITGVLDLTGYFSAPAAGGTPAASLAIPSGSNFTGTINWNPNDSSFDELKSYTATVELTATGGYEFGSGIYITYSGGTVGAAANNGGTLSVPIKFAALKTEDITVDDKNLTRYIPAPVAGSTGIRYFSAPQYSGTVRWRRKGNTDTYSGLFAAGTAYTATVTLRPNTGYTFTGVNEFIHTGGAVGNVSDAANGNVSVPIAFTALARTTVDDYNLTRYILAPVTGAAGIGYFNAPQYSGTVAWKITANNAAHSGPFAAGTAYTATVTLTPNTGYTFDGVTANAFTHTGGAVGNVSNAGQGKVAVPIAFAAIPLTQVTQTVLTSYIPAPVTGAAGIGYFNTPQYSGTVAWSSGGLFAAGTPYTATVTLTPNTGYTFTGMAANAFTHTGGTVGSVSDAGDGKVTVPITFAAIPHTKVDDYNLIRYIPAPVTGATGIGYFNAPQYSGTVAWKITANNAAHSGPFAAGTAYTATVTLTPNTGYTFNGVAANAFTHTGASSVTYVAGTSVVTINFAATDPPPPVMISDLKDLWQFVPKPIAGATPVSSFATGKYVGALSWTDLTVASQPNVLFVKGHSYEATIRLTPFPGYAFDEDALYALNALYARGEDIGLPGGVSLFDDLMVTNDSVFMTLTFLPDPEEDEE